ncbi:MAG: energy transducer TonB [Cyclobacteriaceae bacterium]
MEMKKNPKLDLERRRGMFLNLGLVISLALVVTAFEWRTEVDQIDIFQYDYSFEDAHTLIPPTVQNPPPKPPKPKAVILTEAEEDVIEPEVLIEVEFDPDEIIPEIEFDEPLPVEVVPEIVVIAEKMPDPNGGMKAFYKFISKHLKYPNQARKIGIDGKVFVQFVVDIDGSLTEIKTVKGIGGGCDEEAERVLGLAPKWNPGKQRGKPVKVRMILPIQFKLN